MELQFAGGSIRLADVVMAWLNRASFLRVKQKGAGLSLPLG
jgi:hypothetical protein